MAVDELEQAIAAAQGGSGRAFAAIHAALAGPVAGYLRGRNVEDPDDLANEVFARVFRTLSTFRGDAERFRSWVFTVAHNASVDDLRRRASRPTAADVDVADCAPLTADPADEVLERLATERVEHLLAALPPQQRDVYFLRVIGDLSIAQTAAVLGKSYEAVKALQRRGARTLKEKLSSQGVPR
jgi:RNA polymerase sigma-70 factor, ECF subfamily